MTPLKCESEEGHTDSRLNDEIHAFYNFMAPTPAEARVRANMIDIVANTIRKHWPSAEVLPFGSWQTGLYLPTGDIDLVVTTPLLNERNKVKLLRDLASFMRMGRITQNVAVISRAKVPIIKFVTNEGVCGRGVSDLKEISTSTYLSTTRKQFPTVC